MCAIPSTFDYINVNKTVSGKTNELNHTAYFENHKFKIIPILLNFLKRLVFAFRDNFSEVIIFVKLQFIFLFYYYVYYYIIIFSEIIISSIISKKRTILC